MRAYCDMKTDEGGWTVLQKRTDGSVDFFRDWYEYKHGFGDLVGEFWLGLDTMHELMKSRLYTLRFDLWDGAEHKFAEFSNASIGSEQHNYTLDYESYAGGTAGNSLQTHRGKAFSASDRNNDICANRESASCSQRAKGGWWYSCCHATNLNGPYAWTPTESVVSARVMSWRSFHDGHTALSAAEMKIKIK